MTSIVSGANWITRCLLPLPVITMASSVRLLYCSSVILQSSPIRIPVVASVIIIALLRLHPATSNILRISAPLGTTLTLFLIFTLVRLHAGSLAITSLSARYLKKHLIELIFLATDALDNLLMPTFQSSRSKMVTASIGLPMLSRQCSMSETYALIVASLRLLPRR